MKAALRKLAASIPRALAFSEFTLPSTVSTPIGIDVGSDGHLWFTEKAGNRIGRLSPDGTIVEFAIDHRQRRA